MAASCVWDVVKGCLTPARSKMEAQWSPKPRPGDAGPEPARTNERSPELRCPALCCTDTTTF